jgi:predicted DsbA family dithiol-disulfide isomerase
MKPDRIELTLFHDVLCGWCWVAEKRLLLLKEELGDLISLEHRPFMVHEDAMPTARERRSRARTLRRVAREKEGRGIKPDLWLSEDPPRSSLPPLIALEAARIVGGPEGRTRMHEALRRAALRSGINVSRDDVLVELAHRVELDVSRFLTALRSSETRRLVIEQHEDAASHGIDAVPAVTIGDEWLLTGARTIDEYREAILRYARTRGLIVPERTIH